MPDVFTAAENAGVVKIFAENVIVGLVVTNDAAENVIVAGPIPEDSVKVPDVNGTPVPTATNAVDPDG